MTTATTTENPLSSKVSSKSDSKKSSSKSDPKVETIEANDEMESRMKALRGKIPAIQFERKNKEEQTASNKYFFGLLPCVGRGSLDVKGGSLPVWAGDRVKNRMGEFQIVDKLGMVATLDDEELEAFIAGIKSAGLRFRGKGQPAQKFNIGTSDPSDYAWRKNEAPLGQFCYFFPVDFLNEKYKGGEGAWRKEGMRHETLIPRTPGLRGGPDGWDDPNEARLQSHQNNPEDPSDKLFGPFGGI